MSTMNYQLLGRTGLRVSELCLGTMTFGEAWGFGAAADEVKRMFQTYVEAGGNFFDSACNYQGGAAESQLGELMGNDRERYVVATKFTMSRQPGDPNGWGNHRKNLRHSLEGSLRRLKTDYIDLYQVHLWDYTVPVPEVMAALDDLVRAGKVLHVGLSDAPAWVVAQANTWAIAHGRNALSTIQIEYSLLERTVEQELVPMARAFELPILAWSPLAFGVLSGKFHGGTSDSKRGEWLNGFLGERADRIVPELQGIAKSRGVSAAQIALAWVKSRGSQTFPIVGARTLLQLRDNLRSVDLRLEPDELGRLDRVSATQATFPNKMWQNPAVVDGVLSGGTAGRLGGWQRPVGRGPRWRAVADPQFAVRSTKRPVIIKSDSIDHDSL
jgi:aryl-alcohol dehydrogenase-like predicted oxidoreductase